MRQERSDVDACQPSQRGRMYPHYEPADQVTRRLSPRAASLRFARNCCSIRRQERWK